MFMCRLCASANRFHVERIAPVTVAENLQHSSRRITYRVFLPLLESVTAGKSNPLAIDFVIEPDFY